MGSEQPSKSPSTRRYTPAEKEQAIRLVRQLRKELGTDQGAVARVASQLGYGVESVRAWVKQADIDEGVSPGTTSADAERIKALEQENRELKRANEMADSTSQRNGSCEMSESQSQEDVDARTSRALDHRAGAAGVPIEGAWLATDRHRQGDRLHSADGGAHGARRKAS